MRLRTGMMAVGAAGALALGAAAPALAAAEPKLGATFTDRDATDGEIAVYIDGCKSDMVTSVSGAFTGTDWNPETDILTIRLKDGLEEGVHHATTTCAGMKPVPGKFEYRDGMVGVPGFGGPTPLKAAYTDRDATDGKIGVRITGCASDKLTVISPAFADTRWNPKTDILTATLEGDLEEGVYHATTFCEGLTAVHGKFEYRDGMVGVPGFGSENDKNDKGPKGDDKPAPDAPETDLPAQDQTSVIPEGGVQTGGGGTAPGQAS